VSETLDELLDTLERAVSLFKARPESRHAEDLDNLHRMKRILEGLDPDEIDALLEDDEEE
jgi:hypothetical protein